MLMKATALIPSDKGFSECEMVVPVPLITLAFADYAGGTSLFVDGKQVTIKENLEHVEWHLKQHYEPKVIAPAPVVETKVEVIKHAPVKLSWWKRFTFRWKRSGPNYYLGCVRD